MSKDNPSPQEVLAKIREDFPERSWDVIIRRFGIGRDGKETLESIGQSYDITRERVRQIEAETLNELRKKHRDTLSYFYEELENFLVKHGGLMHRNQIPARFVEDLGEQKDWQGFVNLILTLGSSFKHRKEDESLHPLWYTQKESLRQAERLVEEIIAFFKTEQDLIHRKEFEKHLQKKYPHFSKRAIFAYLECSKDIDSNVFDEYGLKEWPEISPRGVRDKAYLVTKKHGKPLHFRDITEHINQANFSDREAKPQTVHNELIKDERFVLVGRGTYALKAWGYEEGTVKEIIKKILEREREPVCQDEIIDKVLQQRLVKEGTIKFNLKANEEFAETAEKHYTLHTEAQS